MIDVSESYCNLIKNVLDDIILSKYDYVGGINVVVKLLNYSGNFNSWLAYYIDVDIKYIEGINSGELWDDIELYCKMIGIRHLDFIVHMSFIEEKNILVNVGESGK